MKSDLDSLIRNTHQTYERIANSFEDSLKTSLYICK